jgi:hypothetical protein
MTPPIRSARCWASELDYLVPGIALARQDTAHIFLDGPARVVSPSLKIGVFKCQPCLPETRQLHAVIVIDDRKAGHRCRTFLFL